ncbi:isochorismatase family protein [Microthyrium microscopicum]|uniref:Isochorismatase family protein n=1 Tax=Microthyrium microscopicum TaxID=703497 RepID=A0A6A6U045_9PEZI|nr:isochorismatase family protein [Microthyrium microscopicum]
MSPTVLILLDLQNAILDIFAESKAPYLSLVQKATEAARAANIPIIYVQTCFRPNLPEVSRRNPAYERLGAFAGATEGNPRIAIASEIAPQADDIVVTKRRVSAFMGSDLDAVLRALGTENMVLAGIATSGAVLSTLRQAADLDFRITVLEDLCKDRDDEVHRVLMEKVFIKQGTVLSTEKWIEEIGKKA